MRLISQNLDQLAFGGQISKGQKTNKFWYFLKFEVSNFTWPPYKSLDNYIAFNKKLRKQLLLLPLTSKVTRHSITAVHLMESEELGQVCKSHWEIFLSFSYIWDAQCALGQTKMASTGSSLGCPPQRQNVKVKKVQHCVTHYHEQFVIHRWPWLSCECTWRRCYSAELIKN